MDFSKNRVTRGKAIRLKCLDCCCQSKTEVRECPIKSCPLWLYRLGKESSDEVAHDSEGEEEIID